MQGIRAWRAVSTTIDEGVAADEAAAEAALLRAGKAGDNAALERLLAQHEPSLYTLCLGMLRHDSDAEDAVQETFLRALGGLSRFRGDAAVRTWLFRIAVHVCLEWKRARRPVRLWSELHQDAGPSFPSPEAATLQNLRLLEALGTLLPRHRAILILKEHQGWSIAEIAAALGWNDKKVQNELYKARRALTEWRERDAREGA